MKHFLEMTWISALAALALACSDDDSNDGVKGLSCGISGGTVVNVIDGDTIKISVPCDTDDDCNFGDNNHSACTNGACAKLQTVRFMGINAPEIKHGNADDVEHCFGPEATDALSFLVGQDVSLTFDPISGCYEKYGRWLAYIHQDGTLLQERLLALGLACIYWYTNAPQKEETLFYSTLTDAQSMAQEDGAGIWTRDARVCAGKEMQRNCN